MGVLEGVPVLPLPLYFALNQYNTGILALDLLPLITMLPCIATLRIYHRHSRWLDLVSLSCLHWPHFATCVLRSGKCAAKA